MKTYEAKQKIQVKIKEVKKSTFEGQFGAWYLIEYISEEGETFFYKGSTPIKFDEDTFYEIKATVKINSFRGEDQVLLQRIGFVDKSIMEGRKKANQEKIDKQIAEENLERERTKKEKEETDRLNFLKIDNEYQEFIGMTISAGGWHYDNGGSIYGVINKIESKNSSECRIYVDGDENGKYSNDRMKEFTFRFHQLDTLLKDGKLPKPNRLSNTGTEARIVK